MFVDDLCDKMDDWQEVCGVDKPAPQFPIDRAAELLGVDRSAMLIWLRAGMPYAVEGDWRTGDGFEISIAWTSDWIAMVAGVAAHQGAEVAARKLRLPSSSR